MPNRIADDEDNDQSRVKLRQLELLLISDFMLMLISFACIAENRR